MRALLLVGPAFAVLGLMSAAAQEPKATESHCSDWTLDGYRLGMRGEELLAVRSVTLHMEGQAQVTLPGKLHGVLVLDDLNRLQKWDVRYDAVNGESLRAGLKSRFGEPVADVSGELPGDPEDAIWQRRTIWRDTVCDAVIIVCENSAVNGSKEHTVSATLARASMLPKGLSEMKTLLR